MRLMVAAALALGLLCVPASAQVDALGGMSRVAAELQSPDAGARDRAIREIERNPGAHAPMVLFALVPALAAAGRDEDAVRWGYFAQIRMVTDFRVLMEEHPIPEMTDEELARQLSAFFLRQVPSLNVPAERRRRLFEDAVRQERRAPRLYSLGLPYTAVGATWPEAAVIEQARTSAVAAMRGAVELEITRAQALAAMDREIAAGGAASEAALFIPEAWRGRVRAVRTVRVDDLCKWPFFAPTPAGAQPDAFIVGCTFDVEGPGIEQPGPDNRLRWLASDTLAQIAETRAPERFWSGQVVVRGGVAQALFQSTDGQQLMLLLLSADGRVNVLTIPRGEATIASISSSGRYALRHRTVGFDVIEFETGTTIRQVDRSAAEADQMMRYSLLMEPSDGRLLVVGFERPRDRPAADLMVLDAHTGREQRLSIAGAMPYMTPMAWGSSQVMVNVQSTPSQAGAPALETYATLEAFEAARQRGREERPAEAPQQNVAIVDLVSMRVEWTGAMADAPQPRSGYQCGGVNRFARMGIASFHVGNAVRQEVLAAGGSFVLETPERGAARNCAISSDGKHLVIVAPPYVHHYEISAN